MCLEKIINNKSIDNRVNSCFPLSKKAVGITLLVLSVLTLMVVIVATFGSIGLWASAPHFMFLMGQGLTVYGVGAFIGISAVGILANIALMLYLVKRCCFKQKNKDLGVEIKDFQAEIKEHLTTIDIESKTHQSKQSATAVSISDILDIVANEEAKQVFTFDNFADAEQYASEKLNNNEGLIAKLTEENYYIIFFKDSKAVYHIDERDNVFPKKLRSLSSMGLFPSKITEKSDPKGNKKSLDAHDARLFYDLYFGQEYTLVSRSE